jgi:hypothetical protein
VVHATVQEVSSVKKNTGATDWDWRAAGTCEDGSAKFVRVSGRLKIAQHFSAGITLKKESKPAKRATAI